MVIVGLFLHNAKVECGFDNPCQNQKNCKKKESEDYFYHFIKKRDIEFNKGENTNIFAYSLQINYLCTLNY